MSTTAVRRKRTQRSRLDTITASIVVRQSKTDDGSMSLQDQEDAARAWCEAQTPPVEVGRVYIERSTSGRRPLAQRPGLREALADVEEGRSQMILTAYFDRFARSVRTFLEVATRVDEAGGIIQTLDMGVANVSTPIGKLSVTLLAAFAEFQADQTGEKTEVTKQRNIDKGVPPFPHVTPAYRKRADGTLEQHPTNAPLVREAIAMRVAGSSFTAIARWLNENGIETDSGKPITVSGVEQMLGSKLLVGEIHFGTFEPNLHAIDNPITDHGTFRQMQAKRAPRGRQTKSDRLLSRLGVLVCGTCGARMSLHYSSTTNGEGERYQSYRCGNRLCSAPAMIRADVIEDAVVDEVFRRSEGAEEHVTNDEEIEAARERLDEASSALGRAIRILATTGLGGEADAVATLDELQAARDAAAADLHRLEVVLGPNGVVSATVRGDWAIAPLHIRQMIVTAVLDRVVVGRDKSITFAP